jgi:poly(3-hydroxybutyrate) depolymerase
MDVHRATELRHLPFKIPTICLNGQDLPVSEHLVAEKPFCRLLEFRHSLAGQGDKILVVAPLSGHFSVLLRDLVLGLLPTMRVYVTDWTNASHVPLSQGSFGFEDNIAYVVDAMRILGPRVPIIGICQSVVPVLAATAIISREESDVAPPAIVLFAGAVDPLANPTPVARFLRARYLDPFRNAVIRSVPPGYPGQGRRVYPATVQFDALKAYFARHTWQHRELFYKTVRDDGADPEHFPFLRLYTSLMDLTAEFFFENIRAIYQDRAICRASLSWRGKVVDLCSIKRTALMTIEGECDDIAAPGQTRAAHDLCPAIPSKARRQLTVPGSGHFALFHGTLWRKKVLPEIGGFLHSAREILGLVGAA